MVNPSEVKARSDGAPFKRQPVRTTSDSKCFATLCFPHVLDFRTELWDEIGYSETERLAFKPMLVTEEGFTDELLQQHTQEAENLSTKFETMKHILEVKCLVKRRREHDLARDEQLSKLPMTTTYS